ncbi:MAG: hypothetical protein KBD76_11180 [Bacteriovorax sp.]|nr:hypothetical protein [Bacteriovorax sp.]
MNDGLLIIERIIVESLSKKERNLQEIIIDTNLEHSLLLNILPNLIMKNIVRYNRGIYSLDKENCFQWLNEVNKDDHVKEEAKELFISLVNQYFSKSKEKTAPSVAQLKIQKVWLTKEEEMVLNSHMAGLEGFFTGVKAARKMKAEKEKTYEQRVVIWGFSQYSDLVEGVLQAV